MLYSRHFHAGGIPLELTDSLKTQLIETAQSLQGSARRWLMARPVKALGPGRPQRAARARRWGRRTMRKGRPAFDSGLRCLEALALRGRPAHGRPSPPPPEGYPSQRRQPAPGCATVVPPSPVSPLDRGRGAAPVERPHRLPGCGTPPCRNPRHPIPCSGHLPAARCQASAPHKRLETDALFAPVAGVQQAAEAAGPRWRLAMEAQATGNGDPWARGGKHRGPPRAAAHDMPPDATVPPGASSGQRWMTCCSRGAPPQGLGPGWSPVGGRGGRWGTPGRPPSRPWASTWLMTRSTIVDGPQAGAVWGILPQTLAGRYDWPTSRPLLGRTPRVSVAGASWKTPGTAPGSILLRP